MTEPQRNSCVAPVLEAVDPIDTMTHELAVLAESTASFTERTGFHCAPGCGKCCTKPDGVWTSIADMLPLARELWRTGRAEEIYDELLNQGESLQTCILFRSEDDVKGRCSRYEFRPAVCRLFGASARRDKNGKAEVLTCSTKKELHSPEKKERIERQIDRGEVVAPDVTSWALKIASILPSPGLQGTHTINRSLLLAIESLAAKHLHNF